MMLNENVKVDNAKMEKVKKLKNFIKKVNETPYTLRSENLERKKTDAEIELDEILYQIREDIIKQEQEIKENEEKAKEEKRTNKTFKNYVGYALKVVTVIYMFIPALYIKFLTWQFKSVVKLLRKI